MSVDATRWVWGLTMPATRKIVLLSMADRAGETHACWPSIVRLEADTCLDRKTIMAAISDLEKDGFVSVTRVFGKGNCYQLLGDFARETSTKNGTGSSTKNGTGSSTKNGTGSSTKNGTGEPVPKTGPVPILDQDQKRDPTSTKNGTRTSTKNGTLNLPLNPNEPIVTDDDGKTEPKKPEVIPDGKKPKDPAEWIAVFSEQHGVDVDHRSFHDRKKFWPLANAWTNAGVTVGQMREACAKAHADAGESIAWLPAYADRVLATVQRKKAKSVEINDWTAGAL